MLVSPYIIRNRTLVLRDTPEHLDFHVQNDDYLAYLATAVGFLEESMRLLGADPKDINYANELRDDLRYVHAKYRITPKDAEDVTPVRPSGNLLGSE